MSIANAAALISGFSEPITVTRKAVGTFSSGVFVPGATTTIAATGSIQPLNGREHANLPELQRASESLKCYTTTELRAADEAIRQPADLVTFRGRTYQVHRVEPWEYDLSFFKCYLKRVES
jgi:hypothetical protein